PAAAPADESARPAAAPAPRRPPPVARGCRASLGASGAAAEFTPSQAVAAGWCLLNAGRPAEAGIAFDRALGAPGRVGADAAYGKSLALLQANDPKVAAAVASQAPLSAQRRGEIGVMALEQRVYDAYNKSDYVGALGLLRQRGGFAVESRDLTLIRAWSLYQLGKIDDAERLFRTLDAQMSTKETRSGLSAIETKRQRMF
ncbi:MAG: hypothetical protein JNK46_16430, partial [Methylobacteriaceae bacterium]|nr:hypothetical protein [Methylobacteriaceae bacterium]